jgi:hypothetical protein
MNELTISMIAVANLALGLILGFSIGYNRGYQKGIRVRK